MLEDKGREGIEGSRMSMHETQKTDDWILVDSPFVKRPIARRRLFALNNRSLSKKVDFVLTLPISSYKDAANLAINRFQRY